MSEHGLLTQALTRLQKMGKKVENQDMHRVSQAKEPTVETDPHQANSKLCLPGQRQVRRRNVGLWHASSKTSVWPESEAWLHPNLKSRLAKYFSPERRHIKSMRLDELRTIPSRCGPSEPTETAAHPHRNHPDDAAWEMPRGPRSTLLARRAAYGQVLS